MTLFQDGGWFMYPLLLCSMVALGVIFAKAWTLRVAHRGTVRVLKEVEEAMRAGDLDKATDVAYGTPGPAAAILLAGLRRVQTKRLAAGELESAITATGTIELGFLERGLIILATVANVAPLLGFMGTVAGMIEAFGAIEAAGQVEPALVAGGIKVALITTAAGLVIAVPVNIMYNFFVTRIDSLIVDMERGADRILKHAWSLEKEGRLEIVKTKGAAAPVSAAGVAGPPTVDLTLT
jgi:biopolymer transport protein ExbB